MNRLTPPRLDLADLGRRLDWLYHLHPFESEFFQCGKVALALLLGIMVLGFLAGALSGYLTGAESILFSALNSGFFAGLVANLLAIAWIGALVSDRLVSSVEWWADSSSDVTYLSADPLRQFRPPRRSHNR